MDDLRAGQNLAFDLAESALPANTEATIVFENKDDGVSHNVAIYTDKSATKVLFTGDIFAGLDSRTYQVPALNAGSYFFRCEVHPTQMTGTLIAQ